MEEGQEINGRNERNMYKEDLEDTLFSSTTFILSLQRSSKGGRKNIKDTKDIKDIKDVKDAKDIKDTKDVKDFKEDIKDFKKGGM